MRAHMKLYETIESCWKPNFSNIENGPFRIEFLTWPACPSMLQWRSLDSVTVKVFP